MAKQPLTTAIPQGAITQFDVVQVIVDLVGNGQISWSINRLDAAGEVVDTIRKARSFADVGLPATAADAIEAAIVAFEKVEGTLN